VAFIAVVFGSFGEVGNPVEFVLKFIVLRLQLPNTCKQFSAA